MQNNRTIIISFCEFYSIVVVAYSVITAKLIVDRGLPSISPAE